MEAATACDGDSLQRRVTEAATPCDGEAVILCVETLAPGRAGCLHRGRRLADGQAQPALALQPHARMRGCRPMFSGCNPVTQAAAPCAQARPARLLLADQQAVHGGGRGAALPQGGIPVISYYDRPTWLLALALVQGGVGRHCTCHGFTNGQSSTTLPMLPTLTTPHTYHAPHLPRLTSRRLEGV